LLETLHARSEAQSSTSGSIDQGTR
jgi:hypothetical protein